MNVINFLNGGYKENASSLLLLSLILNSKNIIRCFKHGINLTYSLLYLIIEPMFNFFNRLLIDLGGLNATNITKITFISFC
ncbi:MAG: hypothetical protein K0S74_382 [Chlamydiales bacterium]|nr:hypothetical protein [Chlamydiales bacterium]